MAAYAAVQSVAAPPAAPPAERVIKKAKSALGFYLSSGVVVGQGQMGAMAAAYGAMGEDEKAVWKRMAEQDKQREAAEVAEAKRLGIPYSIGAYKPPPKKKKKQSAEA